ncbi:MAG: pyruvate kinase [Candidatus Omnitrophica bacterium]|nr:pyruvate kinase [Candidatus Omnitrophota bacterium]
MSRIKIVATIGPTTCDAVTLGALCEAGMDIARLNGSHNQLDWHRTVIERLREMAPAVPILLDLPGRKIRVANLPTDVRFQAGDTIVFTTAQDGGGDKVPINAPALHGVVSKQDSVLVDDGQFAFTVVDVGEHDLVCQAQTSGTLTSAKGLSIPTALWSGLTTEADKRLIAFACEAGVDFIGASFIDSAQQLEAIRMLIGSERPRIIAKIETPKAMQQLEEILESADAIMIDRGDLSTETRDLERVVLHQKRILASARRVYKPVIIATEMLHSMVRAPVPTKAEVSDISNAVLDGASAVMLSAETAVGAYPIEAVKTMRRIVDAVSLHRSRAAEEIAASSRTIPEAVGEAIALLCRQLPITKIVAITKSGYAARAIATHHPVQPILAVSDDAAAARSFQLFAGTEGVHVDVPFSRTSTDHIPRCLEVLWRREQLTDEDIILVTAVGYPRAGNRMNLIQTFRVADLRENLGWRR